MISIKKSHMYSPICTEIFRRKEVSLQAKGLFACIVFDITLTKTDNLSLLSKNGNPSTKKAFNELIHLGYIKKESNDYVLHNMIEGE